MASIWQRLLSRGSQTAPRIADDVIESKALREAVEELGEETPEVLGKGTSRAAREASEDIPEAVFSEVTPTTGMDDMSWLSRMDPRLKKFIGGAGALTGGGLLLNQMGEEDEVLPITPEEPVKAVEQINPEAVTEQPIKQVQPQAPTPEGLDFDALAKKFDQGMAGLPQEEAPVRDEMQDAIDRAERTELLAMLGKSASQIGAGIATVGAGQKVDVDSSGFDTLLKTAGAGISRVKDKQGFEKAKAELGDEKAMRDPNSEISKLVSDLAQKTGLIKPGQQVSAMSLKNSGVNLGTLLSTIEAAKGRKAAAELARTEKVKTKEDKLNEQQRKFVQGLRKEATSGVLGKQYATFSTGQRMSDALEEFASDPSGYSDYATLMGGLKVLQGDESVVREAEVRMGMSATSLFDSLQNQLQKLQSGKSLQPNQRQAMIKTIKTLTDLSKQQYVHSVQPILEQAEMEGIDPSLILTGSLKGAKSNTKDNNSKQVVKKQYSASRDQTKLIFSDGSEEIVDGKQ